MSGLDAILQAALAAPAERREAALLLLKGQTPRVEPFLSLVGLSKAIGISVSTLGRWRPPSHELGGRRRYRLSEVQEFFASEDFRRRIAALRADRAEYRARQGAGSKHGIRSNAQSQAEYLGVGNCKEISSV